ncbi:hypothetical protein WAF17_05490 [Bernardetia sp. ABR2-2B]|uniref:hypothetical protein n=1 Tax=Bernardetia sp. ABR2-2B TaxID=3127472 RepID=UPI0030CEBC58
MIKFTKTHIIPSSKSQQELEYIFDSSVQTVDEVQIIKMSKNSFKGVYTKGFQWGENIYSTIKIDNSNVILSNTSDFKGDFFLLIFYVIFWSVGLGLIFSSDTVYDSATIYHLIICVFFPLFGSLAHRINFSSQEAAATKIYKSIIKNDFPIN